MKEPANKTPLVDKDGNTIRKLKDCPNAHPIPPNNPPIILEMIINEMLVSNEKMFAILFDKIDCPSISICNNNDTQANKTPKKPLIN